MMVLAAQIEWHDERIVIEGEARGQSGTLDITATFFRPQGYKPEWQLIWRFFSPQQLLLSSGFVGGFENREQALAAAEEVFLVESAKSAMLHEFRKSQGWKCLH